MIILWFLVVGTFSGWLAALLLRRRASWGQLLVAGLAGSFVGGTIGSLLAGDGFDVHMSGIVGSTLGAILVLLAWGARGVREA